MKRSSFLKTLGALFVAPAVLPKQERDKKDIICVTYDGLKWNTSQIEASPFEVLNSYKETGVLVYTKVK